MIAAVSRWLVLGVAGVCLALGGCRTPGLETIDGALASLAADGRLRVVSWNAQKFRSPDFPGLLDRLLREDRPDLVFLQEATREALKRERFRGAFARSWRFPLFFRSPVGVATLAGLPVDASEPFPTRRREFGVTSPKMSLATTHPLPGGSMLLAVNVHCLNFERWGTSAFRSQLDEIEALLLQHDGPIVLAGDFNTWSGKRLDYLQQLAQRHALVEAKDFPEGRRTGSTGWSFTNWLLGIDADLPLDRVFYRGFRSHTARVLPYDASDHPPIEVTLYLEPLRS